MKRARLLRPWIERRPEWAGMYLTHPAGIEVLVLADDRQADRVLVTACGEDALSTEKAWLPSDAIEVVEEAVTR